MDPSEQFFEDPNQPLDSFDSCFTSDESVRPWLYGNWWKRLPRFTQNGWESEGDTDLQLIGISVRLGTGPKVDQGEGNDAKKINFRGTAVRVRTWLGVLRYRLYFGHLN